MLYSPLFLRAVPPVFKTSLEKNKPFYSPEGIHTIEKSSWHAAYSWTGAESVGGPAVCGRLWAHAKICT